jgi:predicted transcriptional regulator
MGNEAIKLELIEWLIKLDDKDILSYLKVVKEAKSISKEWWACLSESQKAGIERGLDDVKNGRTVSYDNVKDKYGL